MILHAAEATYCEREDGISILQYVCVEMAGHVWSCGQAQLSKWTKLNPHAIGLNINSMCKHVRFCFSSGTKGFPSVQYPSVFWWRAFSSLQGAVDIDLSGWQSITTPDATWHRYIVRLVCMVYGVFPSLCRLPYFMRKDAQLRNAYIETYTVKTMTAETELIGKRRNMECGFP